MKKLGAWVAVSTLLLLALAAAVGCDSLSGCNAGDMRCHNNIAQMCSANSSWEDYQNCSSVGQTCGEGPGACSGYTGLACCN